MINQRDKKIMIALDVLEIILSLIAFSLFTFIFLIESTMIRFLFLIGDLYVVYSFTKTLSSLQNKVEKRAVTKNANTNVEAKYLKKISQI